MNDRNKALIQCFCKVSIKWKYMLLFTNHVHFKGEVHSLSSHTESEGLNNMNTIARKCRPLRRLRRLAVEYVKKCPIQQKHICVYLVFGCLLGL